MTRSLRIVRLLVEALVHWLRRPPAGEPRIVAPAEPAPRAELAVLVLLGCASVSGAGFVAVYALDRVPHQTQFLGLSFGLMLAFVAAALVVFGRRLVSDEEAEEDYPESGHAVDQREVVRIVRESGDGITRKRLLKLAALGTGGVLGAALITPAVSLGPVFDTDRLYHTPWRRGRRLVDSAGRPYRAGEIERGTFYTAYPEGQPREDLAAPLVVVRLDPAELRLPAGRQGWAPGGILAYSKTCTHAACAIALYRTPLFRPTAPRPALVCPCHYSTFDPATGGTVLFGPAGRPLPQLPLVVDGDGHLRAGGDFSGPVGPSWWGVRER